MCSGVEFITEPISQRSKSAAGPATSGSPPQKNLILQLIPVGLTPLVYQCQAQYRLTSLVGKYTGIYPPTTNQLQPAPFHQPLAKQKVQLFMGCSIRGFVTGLLLNCCVILVFLSWDAQSSWTLVPCRAAQLLCLWSLNVSSCLCLLLTSSSSTLGVLLLLRQCYLMLL
jgi:hypothetical protein